MAFVDTNVLLRWILQDNPIQCQRAGEIIDRAAPDTLVITDIVASEVSYVLRLQRVERSVVADSLWSLRQIAALRYENNAIMRATLRYYTETNLDFADCYLLARSLREGQGLETLDMPLRKIYQRELAKRA